MPFGLGMAETIVIFLVVLLLFGAKRLPEIGTSLGKGIREFKSSVREVRTSVSSAQMEGELPPAREEAEGQNEGAPRRLTTG